ncbi:DExH-box ATP-dependent RNA helicase DExH3 [Vitis vinifera]|uniref:RNA helicase n=1 Tax=Vitis vinifera TaxID=29760 RepID=A0A438C139_VITVI|nr:DExH-box ATP-dependent RNA helicase DExH3 [Vitis vinifera]
MREGVEDGLLVFGASAPDTIDEWKWKFTMLLRNKDKQELVSREKKDRRDFEQIAILASRMGLYSHLYVKVVVFSKVPLPNYRFDLDDRRPQREVILPLGLDRRVEAHLEEYLSQKFTTNENFQDIAFSRSSSTSSIATDEGLFEQPEPLAVSRSVIEKIVWRRSLQLRNQQQAWQESTEGRKMLEFRGSLPASKEKDALLTAISGNQVVIVSGETGCGKTTQIPQFILESEIESVRGAVCSIICTQPRRISAMSVSERVAAERGEKLGESVGYKVRLEGMKGKDTCLLFCTTGILLRRLLVDRNLKGVTHVIVDEIHERGMNEDFLLIVLKDLLPRRPELRLILMSATLDAELFSSYFDGAPVVHIPVEGFLIRIQPIYDQVALARLRRGHWSLKFIKDFLDREPERVSGFMGNRERYSLERGLGHFGPSQVALFGWPTVWERILCHWPTYVADPLQAVLFWGVFGRGGVGFTYPIRTYFLENILEMTGYRLTPYNQVDDYGQEKMWKMNKQAPRKRKSQLAPVVEDALRATDFKDYSPQTQESLSFFMTGWDDISSLKDKLQAQSHIGRFRPSFVAHMPWFLWLVQSRWQVVGVRIWEVLGVRIDLEKSELIPVGMVENLEELTLEFGCKVGALLFSYLGLPFKFVVLLDGAEERLLQKFVMWKIQYISKGQTGRGWSKFKEVFSSTPRFGSPWKVLRVWPWKVPQL